MKMIKYSDGRINLLADIFATHEHVLENIDKLNIFCKSEGYEEIERTYWLLEETWKCGNCNTIYRERIDLCEKCGNSNIECIEKWIKDGLKR